MNTKFLIFTLGLITMTACSSDNDLPETTGQQQQGNGVPITIEVSEAPLTDPNGAGTRAPITDKQTLDHFYMHYFYEGMPSPAPASVKITNDRKTWNTVPKETPVYFFAFANVDYVGNDYSPFSYNRSDVEDQSLEFESDEFSNGQMDLLVSTQKSSQQENETKPVHFYFHHACAALQFSLSKTEALENIVIQVKEVKLHNVKDWGVYNFNTKSWQVEDHYANYTLAQYEPQSYVEVTTEPMLLTKKAGVEDDYMFMIPQTLTGWSGSIEQNNFVSETNPDEDGPHNSYLEIICDVFGQNNRTVYLPFSDTWKKGYIHRYNIRMGTNLRDKYGNLIFSNNNS